MAAKISTNMNEWENKIKQVQFAFEKKQFNKAIQLSKHALAIGNRAFYQIAASDIKKAVATIVISHFHLADSYIAIQAHNKALSSYQNCLNFLIKANQINSNNPIDHSVAIAIAIVKIDEQWHAFKQCYDKLLMAQFKGSIEKFERELKQLQPCCCQKGKQNFH